jgi:succinate dehydrogenase / fumarate reductase flavoprotein subunit
MEVGPTTHYVMGGVRVDADTQMSKVPGLFAAGECASGINGANRLGGNSLSDLIVFGKRAGEYAAKYAKEAGARKGALDSAQVEAAVRWSLAPFDRPTDASGPFQIQYELQELMQENVGIVRREDEMKRALEAVKGLQKRAEKVGVPGNREYNPGWSTALDLHPLLTVSEAIAKAAIERKESRGGHFRDDYPDKDPQAATWNSVVWRAPDGSMQLRREPVKPLPPELKQIIEEQAK